MKTLEHVHKICFLLIMSKSKVIALVRLVDIERGLFQFVFFDENETERMFWLFWSDLGN